MFARYVILTYRAEFDKADGISDIGSRYRMVQATGVRSVL